MVSQAFLETISRTLKVTQVLVGAVTLAQFTVILAVV